MEGYQYIIPQYYYKGSEVQFANMTHMPNNYFANTMNSHVGVARPISERIPLTHGDSSYANYSMQMPASNMYAFNFNISSNMQHTPVYTSATEQTHVPMNICDGQTNMGNSTNFYGASNASNFDYNQTNVPSIYSSAMQSQYVVSPQNMPMNDKIGHTSFGHSANYSQPSYIAQGTVGVEVASTIPASYTNVNSYNSASSVTFNPSRVNKNSATLHTPVQTSVACFLPPAQLQNFGNTCTLPSESKSIGGQLHVDKFIFEDT